MAYNSFVLPSIKKLKKFTCNKQNFEYDVIINFSNITEYSENHL